MNFTRRDFLKTTAAAAVAFPAMNVVAQGKGSVSASDKLNVALIGCGGMGMANLNDFLLDKTVECVALCDIDKKVLQNREEEIVKKGLKKPAIYGDYRKILERKDVDVVIIGTPDHWHCLQMTDACAAGKDVYVEKPIANSIAECDAMVAAAQRYNRVVQVGQQQRSGIVWKKMIEYLRSGKLGTIGRVHVWANFDYAAVPQHPDEGQIPESVDFNTWLGPAPQRTFNGSRFHGLWRMFWDYGGGLLTDWGVHLLDMGLWGMDITTLPKKTLSSGGKFLVPEGMHETYDTQTVIYQYDNFIMTWEHNAGVQTGPYGKMYGILFRGTNGTLVADRDSWEIYPEYRKQGQLPETIVKNDNQEHINHVNNFLECVRTRNRQTACTIENGSLCAKYAHLGNIAARVGGAALVYDDVRKKFDNSSANKYQKPVYRAPWKFPTLQ